LDIYYNRIQEVYCFEYQSNFGTLAQCCADRTYHNFKKGKFCGNGDNIYFLVIKPTRCTNFSNFIFEMKLHVWDSSSVHHQEFFTVHTAMVYVTQVCWQLASRIRKEPVPSWSCSQAAYKPVWHTIAKCTENNSWWWTEKLSETCRVSFPKWNLRN
jgi:hypothetical protein